MYQKRWDKISLQNELFQKWVIIEHKWWMESTTYSDFYF